MSRLLGIIVLAIMAGGLSACDRGEDRPHAKAGAPILVTVAPVATIDTAERLEAGGVVAPRESAVISSRLVATIAGIRVKAGDRVRASDVLITLDARDVTEHSGQARASAVAAESGLTHARTEQSAAESDHRLATAWQQRIATLHARQSATDQERDEAEARLSAAAARLAGTQAGIEGAAAHLASARAAVGVATATESFTTVRAPFDGLVTERLTDPGNLAAPGVPLLRVESDGARQIVVRVDEARAAYVNAGDRVSVSIDAAAPPAADDRELEGVVGEVARAIGADQRAFTVKVNIPPAVTARTGSFARVVFKGAARRALLVPAHAIQRQGQVLSVYVVQDGVARLRLIRAGASSPQGVEVLAGLETGESIVVSPLAGLADGASVKVGTEPGRGGGHVMNARLGLAGRLAATFIPSKLTPLLIVGSMALGAFAIAALPREEEPQIIVPMVDVFVALPGASPAEVEQRVTRPMEKLLWEVPGVEYLYSTSSPGQAMVIVRFLVGEDEERALVRLNQKLQANVDRIPPGASPPMVKPRSIDDVPIAAVTLWGDGYEDDVLRSLAAQLREALAEVPDVSEVTLLGGRPREIGVELDPARLAAAAIDPVQLSRTLEAANARATGTGPVTGGNVTRLESGHHLDTVSALRDVVVSAQNERSIRLSDVARVTDGDAPPTSYVRFYSRDGGSRPAVTLAVAKRKGANAITVAHQVEAKLATVRPRLLPGSLNVTVTRNYGETAAEKSNELLDHMFLAVISVSLLIALALGFREALVVLTAIPVTLALTLFAFWAYGYTLNRITLFALIFSIGILVDDAIVVVENIVRHARMRTEGASGFVAIAVRAVDEVGNPTILATLTVVAAILPMAFVGGLMGPYMRPIPVGASAAMLFSLAAAFLVTPWAAARLLRAGSAHGHATEGAATRLYRRAMAGLIGNGRMRLAFLAGVAFLLLASAALVPLKLVTVKMLPFDNKSEFQVIVDMPEGTPLEHTARVTSELAHEVLKDVSVVNVQSYVGLSSPYNFNGLVRHYFLRRGDHLADLQVNLASKDERSEQSHAIAKRVRDRLVPIARRFNATIQVSEVPPGPPVLQTLVAEVYGPDPSRRLELAGQVKSVLEQTPGVVDVDWYVAAPQAKTSLVVDESRAGAAAVTASHVSAAVQMATEGRTVGLLHDAQAREDVPIVLRLPRPAQGSLAAVRELRLGPSLVAVGELTREETRPEADSLYHKNLLPVTYVTGDLAGADESPVYAILRMNRAIANLILPEGYAFEIFNTHQPFDTTKYSMKWDGEWHITYEVFRDLGLAFAAVLVLIYILVVWWFEAFDVPLTIMAAIPFSLVGILPAHAAMGAFFTATSMIGFIAGAGIVVRNSIILVDFIEMRVREGMPLAEAVVDAGAVRFRPMALTAAAVIVGSAVILFDPIFQGLAISLMAGEVASLLLSRVTVPVLYFMAHRKRHTPAASVVFVPVN